MTNKIETDMTDIDANEPSLGQRLFRWAQAVIAFLLLVYLLGMMTGATVAIIEKGSLSQKAALIVFGALAGSLFCGWWLWKLKIFSKSTEPISPRTKKARRFLWVSVIFGMAIGLVLSLSALSVGSPADMFSNAPLPTTPALLIAIAYAAFLPIAGWLHLRSVDEHDARANYEGSLAGMYAYSTITPAWWLLARGGLVPPVDAMVVFLIVMVVWGIVWTIRRGL